MPTISNVPAYFPLNLSATLNANSVDLTWAPTVPTDELAASLSVYQVMQFQDNQYRPIYKIAAVADKTATYSYTVTTDAFGNAINNTKSYTFFVIPKNKSGYAGLGDSVRVSPASKPTTPVLSGTYAANGTLSLSWTPSSVSSGTIKYHVYSVSNYYSHVLYKANLSTAGELTNAIAGQVSTTYNGGNLNFATTVSSLSPLMFFVVRAKVGSTFSDYSNVLTLAPPCTSSVASELQNNLSTMTNSETAATLQYNYALIFAQSLITGSISVADLVDLLAADNVNGMLSILLTVNSLKQSGHTDIATNVVTSLASKSVGPQVLNSAQIAMLYSTVPYLKSPDLPTDVKINPPPTGNIVLGATTGIVIHMLVPNVAYYTEYTAKSGDVVSNILMYLGNDQILVDSVPYSVGDNIPLAQDIYFPFYAAGTAHIPSITDLTVAPTTTTSTAPTTTTSTAPTTTTSTAPTTTTSTAPSANNIPCFVAGTRICTPSGEKAVETLRTGDIVTTSDGRSVSIKAYSTTVANATEVTAPYVVAAHSFGRNAPPADLHLSPLHAFQIKKGVWMNPRYADKATVQQYGVGECITYYHIECPNYFRDNLVANGCVVESFAGKQTQGAKNIFTYNKTLGGFTRVAGIRRVAHKNM
jgi:Hint domain